ncbi:MAG: aspartate aminotransferase family protein [Pirellulaceae bacterium]|nr:aspartate aminotransferase family protein [Pirellulaceae bacterium]
MTNDEWIKREQAVLTPASHRLHDPKFGVVFSRGQGARLWDVAGRNYIDFTCGYSASNFGHAFPPLVEVARRQVGELTHLTQEPHAWRAPLAEKLIEICGFGNVRDLPGEDAQPPGKVHFNATGSRAVETAWKAARAFRPGRLISLAPSYHGRSLATSTLSDTVGNLPEFVPSHLHERRPASDFAYCAACTYGLSHPACQTLCLNELIQQINSAADSISAVIVEPALGARGYVFPPAEYWQRLRRATADKGVLLIADEIQMGLGRTGTMLLSTSQGWQPDLIVLGKSLGGGIVPISAVVGRAEVMNALPIGSESETFAGTPLAAALALEVLEQLTTGPWLERGSQAGKRLRQALEQFGDGPFPGLIVEGQGASAVAEFKACGATLVESQALTRRIAVACRDQGLLVHFSGPLATRIVLLPPLSIDDAELNEGIQRLQKAMECP